MNEYNKDEMVSELLKFANEIISGNYFFSPNSNLYSGVYMDLFKSILEIRNKMRVYVFETQVASSQVLSATDELTLALDESTETTKNLLNKSQEIQKLNTQNQASILSSMEKIKGISYLFNDIKDTVSNVQHATEQTKAVINESIREIWTIVESVESIKESASNTAEYIEKLNISTEHIKDILATVNDISRQTHIISLNAAIESARAGVEGRGFAVLTEEIRVLSSQTRDAVGQISELILNITDEMKMLQKHIFKELDNVQKSVDYTKNVESSLVRIESSYDEVQNMVEEIAAVADKEREISSIIDSSVLEVKSISQTVLEEFDNVYNSVSKQNNTINELSKLGSCLSSAAESLSVLSKNADADLIEQNAELFSNKADNLLEILQKELLSTYKLMNMSTENHKAALDEVLGKYGFLEAIWSNDKKGKFIYSNPSAGIANAKVRDWFKASIKGYRFTSSLYISAITKNPCITVSLPITKSDGEIIGVVGADLKLNL